MMKKYLFFLSFLALFSYTFTKATFANTLLIEGDKKITLISDDGSRKDLSKPISGIENNGNVLGSSTGITITVLVSPFGPTNTPTPTFTPTPTPTSIPNTPTPTTASSSTSTPTPTSTPTNNLLATIGSESEIVSEVVLNDTNGNTVVTITSATDSGEMLIQDGKNSATTSLPIQLNSDTKDLQAVTKNGSSKIIIPSEAIDCIKSFGTFIIPSSINIKLIQKDGKPVYEVKGQEYIQIFSKFTIKLPLTVNVDATTCNILKTKESIITRILVFLRIGKRVIRE